MYFCMIHNGSAHDLDLRCCGAIFIHLSLTLLDHFSKGNALSTTWGLYMVYSQLCIASKPAECVSNILTSITNDDILHC